MVGGGCARVQTRRVGGHAAGRAGLALRSGSKPYGPGTTPRDELHVVAPPPRPAGGIGSALLVLACVAACAVGPLAVGGLAAGIALVSPALWPLAVVAAVACLVVVALAGWRGRRGC